MKQESRLVREAWTLMKRHEREPEHVQHVTQWAVYLFEELRPLHRLEKMDLEFLTAAALLHDTGWSTATEDRSHHKESARLIRQHSWKNLSRKESEFVALIARYHRKSPPSSLHKRYANLPKKKKESLQFLAGILRVADAMDRSHRQNLHPAGVQLRPGVCLILARGDSTEEASFGLERKGDLFRHSFDRQPIVQLTS